MAAGLRRPPDASRYTGFFVPGQRLSMRLRIHSAIEMEFAMQASTAENPRSLAIDRQRRLSAN